MYEIVSIDSGRIRGATVAGGAATSFLGIPYAAAPVGDLRWRPPQPVLPWAGVRDAIEYGPAGRQPAIPSASIYYGHETRFSEDCLYLNVWTAPAGSSAGRPVMVWLHPGAYQFGSGQNPLYDGAALARAGITLVTLNHRLGRFGFLAHPWLSVESGYGGSGNYGLMDILEALRWIQPNIEQFGGDPENVTVFGVSAGGNSVHNLRTSPSAAGLLHRSIAQSGPGVGPVLHGLGHALGPSTLEAGEQAGQEITDLLSVYSVAALRRLPADEIEAAVLPRTAGDWRFRLIPDARISTHVFDGGYPVIDGHVLPQSPLSAYRRREQLDIPFLVGSAGNESSGLPYLSTLSEYRRFLVEEFGAFAGEAFDRYPAESDADVQRASWDLEADRTFVWSGRTAARMQHEMGSAPVWHYQFNRAPVIPQSSGLIESGYAGAFHTAEVPYIFRNLRVRAWPWTSSDHTLSEQISSAWINFARNGNPNGEGVPNWPTYQPSAPSTLVWDLESQVADPFDQDRMDFLDRFNARWDGTPASVASASGADADSLV